MDIDGLEELLKSIEQGEKTLVARDVTEPSPLAQEILSARPYAYLDDAPLEERRTQAVMSRRWLDPETARDLGVLDQDAIDRVREEAWPQAENPDELHDALVQLGFITQAETISASQTSWPGYFAELIRDRRAAVLHAGERSLWVAVRDCRIFSQFTPKAGSSRTLPMSSNHSRAWTGMSLLLSYYAADLRRWGR